MATSRTALDLNIREILDADNGRPKTTEELAAPAGASLKLFGQLARHLAAMGMMDQTGPEEFAQNRLAKVLSFPKYREDIYHT